MVSRMESLYEGGLLVIFEALLREILKGSSSPWASDNVILVPPSVALPCYTRVAMIEHQAATT